MNSKDDLVVFDPLPNEFTASRNPPDPSLTGDQPFESVEERLLEAFSVLARLPDGERRFLRHRTMGLWREVVRERVDIDCEPSPARPGVSRHELQRMTEALGWCERLSGRTRRVVGATVEYVRRMEREPDWPAIRRQLREERTTDALRMEYSRALRLISHWLNA